MQSWRLHAFPAIIRSEANLHFQIQPQHIQNSLELISWLIIRGTASQNEKRLTGKEPLVRIKLHCMRMEHQVPSSDIWSGCWSSLIVQAARSPISLFSWSCQESSARRIHNSNISRGLVDCSVEKPIRRNILWEGKEDNELWMGNAYLFINLSSDARQSAYWLWSCIGKEIM